MRSLFAILGASVIAVTACGARSALPFDEPREGADAGPDVVTPPECDGGTTFIYVVTEENVVLKYDPPSGEFTPLFTMACPGEDPMENPFSMAVDRQGVAYVVFSDGNLFRVSIAEQTCEPTSYQPTNFNGNVTFGMGFSANVSDPGETLFVASDGDPTQPGEPESLGSIDVSTFQLSTVGQFPHIIGSAELTGTGDGRLFGFGVDNIANSTVLRLLEFDKTNAGLLSESALGLASGPEELRAWAFAYWGGDFYFFTSTDPGSSTVSRHHLDDSGLLAETIGTLSGKTIVGAGVSTCAPQE